MLNQKEETRKYTTNCLQNLEAVFIARPAENNGVQVVMLGITEEQEKKLDKGEDFIIKTNLGSFHIESEFCFAYGELDLSPNSDDIIKMDKADWFKSIEICHWIPSEYDYETHTVTSDKRGGRTFSTIYLRDYLPYLHGCINKPKRIVIFKEYLKAIISNKVKAQARRRKAAQNREYRANKDAIIARTIAKRKAKVSGLKFNIKK